MKMKQLCQHARLTRCARMPACPPASPPVPRIFPLPLPDSAALAPPPGGNPFFNERQQQQPALSPLRHVSCSLTHAHTDTLTQDTYLPPRLRPALDPCPAVPLTPVLPNPCTLFPLRRALFRTAPACKTRRFLQVLAQGAERGWLIAKGGQAGVLQRIAPRQLHTSSLLPSTSRGAK